jgi:hypothetical protein
MDMGEQISSNLQDFQGFRALMTVLCTRDTGEDDAECVFGIDDLETVDGQLPGGDIHRICSVALRLNKMTEEEVDALEGNSGAGQGAGSCSS